jgi:hypothetical protein
VNVKDRPRTSLGRKAESNPTQGVLSQRFVLFLTRRHGFGSGLVANPIFPSQDEEIATRTWEAELPR